MATRSLDRVISRRGCTRPARALEFQCSDVFRCRNGDGKEVMRGDEGKSGGLVQIQLAWTVTEVLE